jgi:hypothetical protein
VCRTCSRADALPSVNWERRLDKWLVRQEGDEWRGFCPLHETPGVSKTPSASFNFREDKKVWICHGCGESGSLWELWQRMQAMRGAGNVRSLDEARERKRGGTAAKVSSLPSDERIDSWTARLLGNERALLRLKEVRGLSEATIQAYELGWDGERYTIPVRDAEGNLLNVRKYKLGARSAKMVNIDGHGGATLYGVDALEHDEVLLTEGEMDKLIAREQGFNSLTTTAGAGTWQAEWSPLFAGKRVYIVYDCDDQGVAGARRVASRITKAGAEAHIVLLPLSTRGADLTNYFVDQGYTAKHLRKLMAETPVFQGVPSRTSGRLAEPVEVELAESFSSEYTDRPIEVVATVVGKSTPPYALAEKVALTCDQDWNGQCGKCPMSVLHNGSHEMQVPQHSDLLLKMANKPEDQRMQVLLKDVGVPTTCKKVEVTPLRKWTVEKLFVVPSIDHVNGERVERVVYNVGKHNTPVNSTMRMVGVSTDDPNNAEMVMQTWECEPTQTSLDRFAMTPELAEELAVFQPAEGQRPIEKLVGVADDLAANVTRIYGRRELHIAYDLVWHSLLGFKFRGVDVSRGWLELLVMGDTRTGKSEAAERLRQHYGAGVLTSCEGATLAGLVGGAQQINNRWVVTWGTIPLQDRRLVVLDEASGLQGKNILENMSEIRSSGTAKVTKVVSQETRARTRLIWISNPPDGRRIDEMPRGAIDAVEDLIRNPEDIARFDLAMAAASADVESSVINAARPPRVPHVYTSELCQQLVLWAWSRTPADVVWERGAARLCLVLAEKMGHVYVPDPPLVQAENARMKLARLAVAVAARLFSHDGTGQKVYVTKEHVRTARTFLARLYRQPSFGYAQHSAKEIHARQVAERGREWARVWLRENSDARGALLAVVNDREFRVRDLEEFGGLSRDMAQIAIAELLKHRMIRRHTKGYIRMEPELVTLLRRLDK